MPRRKASFRIPKDQSSPLCTSGEDDSSSSGPPRQPKRRYRLDTADLLQEALDSLRLCDLNSSSRREPEHEPNEDNADDVTEDNNPTESSHPKTLWLVEKQQHRPSVVTVAPGQ